MDAIVISGGRGSRLGFLTHHCNKGAIRFQGIPVATRIVDSLCQIQDIDKIHFVTGHQSQSIECVLENLPHAQSQHIAVTRGPSKTIGMLQRIALAIPTTQCSPGALVMGIDSLVPTRVIKCFVSKITHHLKRGENRITILCSTDTSPAPTHYLVQEEKGKALRHLSPKSADATCTLRSVGIRYFPCEILNKIYEDAPRWYGKNISPYISHLMTRGTQVHIVATSARWVHIGYPRDFGAKP